MCKNDNLSPGFRTGGLSSCLSNKELDPPEDGDMKDMNVFKAVADCAGRTEKRQSGLWRISFLRHQLGPSLP